MNANLVSASSFWLKRNKRKTLILSEFLLKNFIRNFFNPSFFNLLPHKTFILFRDVENGASVASTLGHHKTRTGIGIAQNWCIHNSSLSGQSSMRESLVGLSDVAILKL